MGAEDAAADKDLSLEDEQIDEVAGGVFRAKRVEKVAEAEALGAERRRAVLD